MIEVTGEINAVRRRVGEREMAAGTARAVVLGRTYGAPAEDVWDAVTDPERIRRWFLPVTGDLRLGGRFHLEGNASGTIERCDPPKGFFATWEFAGQTSWIEVRLTPEADGGTRLELEHITHVDDHWEQFGPGAVGIGWESGFLGLALHLPSGADLPPGMGPQWLGSDEGRDFIRRSAELWYEADVASGTPRADARARADRTTAAYTGPME